MLQVKIPNTIMCNICFYESQQASNCKWDLDMEMKYYSIVMDELCLNI